jgi:hypothetical protein
MTDLASLATNARKTAQERLGKAMVQEVSVQDYVDEDGEPAFEVVFVLQTYDPEVLTAENRSWIVRSIIRKLKDEGDSRFPFVKFISRDELAEIANDD